MTKSWALWPNFELEIVTKFKVGRCEQQRKLGFVTKLDVVATDKLGVMSKTEKWAA